MKNQAKQVRLWKYGARSFICMILFVILACSEGQIQEVKDSSGQNSNIESTLDDEVFTIVEEQPQYPGGMEALYKYMEGEIRYPKEARTKGVEGRVDVQFVVEKDGILSDVKVIRGIDTSCDNEAVRVVQNAQSFTPGSQRGKRVRVRMVMPIVFKLDDGKTNPDNSPQGIVVIEKVETNNGRLQVEADYANGAWSGTVYDPEGAVIPGVNIVVPGTSTGTVSDLDGSFKVKTNETQSLQLSFVGYESVQVIAK